MKRLPLGILLLIALISASVFSDGRAGFSVNCDIINGCVVAAESSINAIVIGLLTFFIIILIPKKVTVPVEEGVGFFRKVCSIFLDIYIVLFGFTAVMTLPMLVVESFYVGEYQWSFTRDFLRITDHFLSTPMVIGSFLMIPYLRVHALTKGKSSFGQYLMGYTVVVPEDKRSLKFAIRRQGLAVFLSSVWPFYLIYKVHKNLKHDLWDILFGTESKQVKYS